MLKCFPSMRAPLLLLALLSGVATGGVCRYTPDANGHVDVPYGETSIDDFAFYACDALVSITLPSSVTRIGDYAFVTCPLLTWVTTSDRLTSIGHSAFYRCNSLAHVSLPDGLTSIGEWAFYKCASLPSVVLPTGIESIGMGAFYGCSSLALVYVPRNCSIGAIAFEGTAGAFMIGSAPSSPPTPPSLPPGPSWPPSPPGFPLCMDTALDAQWCAQMLSIGMCPHQLLRSCGTTSAVDLYCKRTCGCCPSPPPPQPAPPPPPATPPSPPSSPAPKPPAPSPPPSLSRPPLWPPLIKMPPPPPPLAPASDSAAIAATPETLGLIIGVSLGSLIMLGLSAIVFVRYRGRKRQVHAGTSAEVVHHAVIPDADAARNRMDTPR